MSNFIILSIRYIDAELVQFACSVEADDWRGSTHAYCGRNSVSGFIDDLRAFSGNPDATSDIRIGNDDGFGLIHLRFYRYDLAGHVACYATLATASVTGHRPEEIARLAIELKTEPGLIDAFAAELSALRRTLLGEATLRCV